MIQIIENMCYVFMRLARNVLSHVGFNVNANAKSQHQKRIECMMVKAGQVLPKVPTVPPAATREARAKLVLEETFELLEALGVTCFCSTVDKGIINRYNVDVHADEDYQPDVCEIAKEAADVSVVTIGTLSSCGISDYELLKLVDDNNLAKFGPGGYLNNNGKWVKPHNHPKPNVKSLLQL